MKKLTWFVLFGFICGLLVVMSGCQSSAPKSAGLMVPEGSTGDPPMIPHDVEPSDGGESCIECHATGEMGAPVYPDWHATLTDCRQCHALLDENAEAFKVEYHE